MWPLPAALLVGLAARTPVRALPLVCPSCGADIRIVAFITEAAPVEYAT